MVSVTAPIDHPFVLIVALDLTDTASGGYALDQATRIAGRVPGSQLHVLHVSTEDVTSETLGLLRHYVSAKATALGGSKQQTVAVHVRRGDPAHEIVQLATDFSADLVIVGTHKVPHLKSLFVGFDGRTGDAERNVSGRGRRAPAEASAVAGHRHRASVYGLRADAFSDRRPLVVVRTPFRASRRADAPPPLFVRVRPAVCGPRLRSVGVGDRLTAKRLSRDHEHGGGLGASYPRTLSAAA